MRFPVRYIIALFIVLTAINLPAQNITGTWEGDLGNDQFLQLNIIQTGDKICGYTRDHVKADKRSFCKAFFEGYYDAKRKKLHITGKYFIQNSGSHTLMKLSLSYRVVKGKEIFEEVPTAASLLSSIMSGFGSLYDGSVFAEPISQYVYIKKVSDRPYEIIDLMKDCIKADKSKKDSIEKMFAPPKPKDSLDVVNIIAPAKPKDSVSLVKNVTPNKPKDSLPPVVKIVTPDKPKESVPPVVKIITPNKPKDSLPPVVKIITPDKPKDSLPTVVKIVTPDKPKDSLPPVVKIITPDKPKEILPPVIIKKDSIAKPKTFTQRKNTEQSHITVNVKSINLKVYDNAIMDGDTVSILYNGKLLLTHQLLSEKGIEINLELDEKQTRHEIVLFAENLGSIPPNTALIVITAGNKRYELFASASLEENAVLVFDYKPK